MASTPRATLTPADFDPATGPRRLNLGCGWDHREGFVNVDMHAFHRPDLLADVRQLGFLPAKHYDEIVAQDVLEHMPRPQTLPILEHWNRMLRQGGTLKVRVPNVVALVDLLQTPAYRTPAKQQEIIHFLFGTQDYNGDFHFTSFTDVLLRHYLEEAGFEIRGIEVYQHWLYDAVAVKAIHVDGPQVYDSHELRDSADDTEFVRTCYRQILQRDPDPGGLETFLTALRAGTLSRQGVIDSLVASPEHKLRNRPARPSARALLGGAEALD